MVKAVMFDLDNTLFDFMKYKTESCNAALIAMKKAGLKINEKNQCLDKALEVYQLASRVEPKSPRVLDLLLEACILNKKRVMAKNTLNKLKKVNPDNQKLDEFKKRIDEIV